MRGTKGEQIAFCDKDRPRRDAREYSCTRVRGRESVGTYMTCRRVIRGTLCSGKEDMKSTSMEVSLVLGHSRDDLLL